MEITKPLESPTGTGSNKIEKYDFDFDHVFNQQARQETVFEEVSQLVQSAIDGYNVCIFAYGQTGSGKTFTMEGDETGQHVGIIPRTIEKIFEETNGLIDKGWKYKMEASFLGKFLTHKVYRLHNKKANLNNRPAETYGAMESWLHHILGFGLPFPKL